jgi:hypothetical protein
MKSDSLIYGEWETALFIKSRPNRLYISHSPFLYRKENRPVIKVYIFIFLSISGMNLLSICILK